MIASINQINTIKTSVQIVHYVEEKHRFLSYSMERINVLKIIPQIVWMFHAIIEFCKW